MNDSKENKLSMFHSVLQCGYSYDGVVNSSTVFGRNFRQFETIVTQIGETVKLRETKVSTVVTKEKNVLKEDLSNLGVLFGGMIQAYAKEQKDTALYSRFGYSYTSLARLRDTIFPTTVSNIFETAVGYKQDLLADYGMVEEDFNEYEEKLARYQEILALPRYVITEKLVQNRKLDDLFEEAEDLLRNRLDNIAQVLGRRNQEFRLSYERSRKVIKD